MTLESRVPNVFFLSFVSSNNPGECSPIRMMTSAGRYQYHASMLAAKVGTFPLRAFMDVTSLLLLPNATLSIKENQQRYKALYCICY